MTGLPMDVGDLVLDSSLGRRLGIIVTAKEWCLLDGSENSEWEYEILYEDGTLDTAYENELEVVSESR